MTQTPPLLPIY